MGSTVRRRIGSRRGPDPLQRGEHHQGPDPHHAESRSTAPATETRSTAPAADARSTAPTADPRSSAPTPEARSTPSVAEPQAATPPAEPRPTPLAYSVTTAAAALGISEYSIYEMVRANRLPHVRIGRRILIPSKLLDAWLTAPGPWAPADTF